MAETSPEANMIRDEMRSAVRDLDASMQRAAAVLLRAESFLRGHREPPSMTRLETPAAPTSLGSLLQEPSDGS